MAERDPIALHGQWLVAEGVTDETTLETIRQQLIAEMDAAVEFAMNAPYPDAAKVDEDVYA
jgi:pyruvate dehydrogenase E1 component alpha subunit